MPYSPPSFFQTWIICCCIKCLYDFIEISRMNAPSIFFIALLVRVSDYRECKPMFVKDNLASRTSDDIEGTKKKSVLAYIERE